MTKRQWGILKQALLLYKSEIDGCWAPWDEDSDGERPAEEEVDELVRLLDPNPEFNTPVAPAITPPRPTPAVTADAEESTMSELLAFFPALVAFFEEANRRGIESRRLMGKFGHMRRFLLPKTPPAETPPVDPMGKFTVYVDDEIVKFRQGARVVYRDPNGDVLVDLTFRNDGVFVNVEDADSDVSFYIMVRELAAMLKDAG